MKKIIILILLLCFVIGCEKGNNHPQIVVTNFPSYDMVRAIVKDSDIKVKMLLKPGSEAHEFEPTPQDIIDIQKSKLFIYTGGESDSIWVDEILSNLDLSQTKVIKLMDLVDLKEEQGALEEDEEEEETEMDEHVWTNPNNVIAMLQKIAPEIVKLNVNQENLFVNNMSNYIQQLEDINNQILDIVGKAKRKTLVFGDRFPLLYFTEQYDLDYIAAFKGCSDANEASAKTISTLIDKVKKEKIPVVFHIELSNTKIAEAVSKETKAKVLEFHTAHNVSQEDFDKGITYVDIYNNNIKVLKEALW